MITNNLHSSLNIIMVIKKGRDGWDVEHAWGYEKWAGNLGKKRSLGRPGIRWEDNIEMDLK
jgi:hypothetical protein